MLHRNGWVVAFAVLFFAAAARADDAPDLTTPRGIGQAFTKALASGDAPAAKALAIVGPQDAELIDALVSSVNGFRKLVDLMATKFGEKDARTAVGMPVDDMVRKFDDADEKIDGDTATLVVRNGDPLKLKKVGNQWKVDLPGTTAKSDGAKLAGVFRLAAKVAEDTAADVSAGKFKSAEEAGEAYQMKMQVVAVASESTGVSTAPSTRP